LKATAPLHVTYLRPVRYPRIITPVSRPVSLIAGTRIGSYEIAAQIGVGGMGEVYRATDTNLKRQVAIKVLPEAVAADAERLVRFQREAQVLASLNHPNIAIIHGLEKSDGVTGLVMELVEGATLADCIAKGAIPVDEALLIARQIAEALEAAHEQGIVHRDLKPANIKVRHDGMVKVLDFGLAKAMEPASAQRHSDAFSQSPTITTPAHTMQGAILGTAAYMSPEQARGRPVDKRTDIWAFGCVLYEMLAGRPAFARQTLTDTLAAVVEGEPDWGAVPDSGPAPVLRLMRRCLDKDQKQRLRDIGDARFEIEAARTASASTITEVPPRRWSARLPWLVAAAMSIVALVSTASAWLVPAASVAPAAPRFSRIVPVTTGPARELGPAISPDGKWIAYISDSGGRPDVWVKFVAGGEAANLTASAGIDVSVTTGIGGLDISPDGTRIAVMARTRGSSASFATWEIPAPLRGVPRKLLDDGFLGMRWAPDGRAITFIRAGAAAGDALWVADAEGTNRREILSARDGVHVHWLNWARDGFIYFIRTITTIANLDHAEIYRINPRGGSPEPVVSTLRRAMYPVPMPDGLGLIYSASPRGVDLGLWWRLLQGGDAQPLTIGTGDFAEPRISADGRMLVATRFEVRQALTRVGLMQAEYGHMTTLTNGYNGDLDPSVSPLGDRLVFSSSRTGDRHIWTARMDGSDARPLTSGSALDDRPTISPDGRQVAFNSDRDGRRGIWVISADGGSPRKLTDASTTGGLSWSRDGRRVVYAAGAGSWPGLWSVSLEDGQVQRIATSGAVSEPVWNPIRDLIAYMEPATSGVGFTGLAFVDSAGRRQYPTLPPAPEISAGFSNGMAAWSHDGRRLAVVSQNSNAAASVWVVDPEATKPFRKLVDLPPGPRIRGVSWTPDSSSLIIGQHDTLSDIVLLEQAQ